MTNPLQPLRRARRATTFAFALLLAACAAPAFAQTSATVPATTTPAAAAEPDPILVSNSTTQIRASDYDLELHRLPPDMRAGFANNKKRIQDLLARMIVTKTLAAQAFAEKLDQDPEIAARFETEVERFFAGARVALLERAAAAEFDAKKASYETRARELYRADIKRFERPEQVKVSHILYKLGTHSKEEGEKLAREARAKILAGEDFNAFASKFSEDGSASASRGRLDWLSRAEVDPAFADAAFALKKPGDISEPVLSQFGWHLIKLDEHRAAGTRPYEEVREQILAEIKKGYVEEKKSALLNAINEDPTTIVNQAAIDALYVEPPAVATPMPKSGTPRKAKAAKPDQDADSAAAEFSKRATERAKRRAAKAGTEAEPAKN